LGDVFIDACGFALGFAAAFDCAVLTLVFLGAGVATGTSLESVDPVAANACVAKSEPTKITVATAKIKLVYRTTDFIE
jgi:hypothetical protein